MCKNRRVELSVGSASSNNKTVLFFFGRAQEAKHNLSSAGTAGETTTHPFSNNKTHYHSAAGSEYKLLIRSVQNLQQTTTKNSPKEKHFLSSEYK